MSHNGLSLLLFAPLVVGFAAWLWRRDDRPRDAGQDTGSTDFSNCANPSWGHSWSSGDGGGGACDAADGGGDGGGGCGDDGDD